MNPNEFVETDSQDNAIATATIAAADPKRHIINYIFASYTDATISGLLTVKRGTTTVLTHHVHGAEVLPIELRGNSNEAMSAALAASGTGGKLGVVTIMGVTDG